MDSATVCRNAVRLVVLDCEHRVLLLHVRDLSNPQFGVVWELPGGGIEPGETHVQAAIRELQEETGLDATPEFIGLPTWRRQVSYIYRGIRWQQQESVVLVKLLQAAPTIKDSLRQGVEKDDVFGARWWSLPQIVTSDERFYPRSLPTLLPEFLNGATLEEPPEQWPEQ